MTVETRYQRVAREQRERQAAREKRYAAEQQAKTAQARKRRRQIAEGRRELAYLDKITGDHDHSMDH